MLRGGIRCGPARHQRVDDHVRTENRDNAKDLQDEIDRYNAQEDRTSLELNRIGSHSEAAVCIDFMYDLTQGRTPTIHADHPAVDVPTT